MDVTNMIYKDFICRICGHNDYVIIRESDIQVGGCYCSNCSVKFMDPKKFSLPIIKIKKLHKDAIVPRKTLAADACMDLHAIDFTCIGIGETILIRTGIAMQLPLNWEALIRPRSGLSLKMSLQVSLGTIDPGYIEDVGIIIHNAGSEIFDVNAGDRMGQISFKPTFPVKLEETEEEFEKLERDGGFGHTGI